MKLPCVAINGTPSCNRKVKLRPSRGLRTDRRSQRRRRIISPSHPPSLHQTGSRLIRERASRVCLRSHSPTAPSLRPCRIHSIPLPHPRVHPRPLLTPPPIISRLPFHWNQFALSDGLLTCPQLTLRLRIRPSFSQANQTGASRRRISIEGCHHYQLSDFILLLLCTFYPYLCTLLCLHDFSFLIPFTVGSFFFGIIYHSPSTSSHIGH